MKSSPSYSSREFLLLEPLEERIAPAALNESSFIAATVGSPLLLHAGQGLSSSDTGGSWMLYVEKGQALVFTTDLNGNNKIDSNEITGISAGDGLRLLSFVDIHGDIVTNLNADGTLTDSDPGTVFADGKVLLNSKIEAITMRSVTAADVAGGDYLTHLAMSSYSIYGNIYAGGGFGVSGGGLTIDTTGLADQKEEFNGITSNNYVPEDFIPAIGSIVVGTAASGQYFNFGITSDTSGAVSGIYGTLAAYHPGYGVAGADIIGVKAGKYVTTTTETTGTNGEIIQTDATTYSTVKFTIGSLLAGDGGYGARGGNIQNIALYGDTGSLSIIAGNGGDGDVGGAGGSITNLTDAGSNVGYVYIQTGHGGNGLIGAGGAGGTLTLGEFKMAANMEIHLNDGGDGLTNGGNGASFTGGTIAPDTSIGIAAGLKVVSSTRDIGDIGTSRSIDFDGDGNSDLVYLSTDPQQIGVLFGDGSGGFSSWRSIFLDSPALADLSDATGALAVADLNDDGFDDIVVASNSQNNLAGLTTYLWNSETGTFNLGLQSALPFFNTEDAEGGSYAMLSSAQAIIDLEIGDFDGDGTIDVAILSHAQSVKVDIEKSPTTILYFARGVGNGLFFVDFGKNSVNEVTETPMVTVSGGHVDAKIEATATTQNPGNAPDILVGAVFKNSTAKAISTYAFSNAEELAVVSAVTATFKARKDGVPDPAGKFVQLTPLDFSVLDIGNDGVFDIVAINTQADALTVLQGEADGGISQPDPNGIALSGDGGLLAAEITSLGVRAIDTNGVVAGGFNTVGLYYFDSATGAPFIQNINVTGYDQAGVHSGANISLGEGKDTNVILFDAYRADANAATEYAFIPPATDNALLAGVALSSAPDVLQADLVDRGFSLYAGNGGDSILGNGGSGGSISNVNFVIPENLRGQLLFVGGDGGNGLNIGGNGGAVSGLTTTYAEGVGIYYSWVSVMGGDGGNGISGAGGNGGSLSNLRTITGYYFEAGDGGDGYRGGVGGSILGRGSASDPDTRESAIIAIAGDGGDGVIAGGAGGSISKFLIDTLDVIGGSGGSVWFEAGDGGNAIAGSGGAGGSIVSSSPAPGTTFAGTISLYGGQGGNGLTGGHGGSITTFVNSPDQSISPSAITVIAGDGGYGVMSYGGNGGNITGVTISGTGVYLAYDPADNILFNRFIAGNGGDSYGAAGGKGGAISNLITTSTSSSTAIAAGAGGDGLLSGGIGGALTTVNANASSDAGYKVLAIAGDGGDAYAMLASSIALVPKTPTFAELTTAFGGVAGVGGNGGSISNFTQANYVDVRTDLISGNGGSTVNYGSAADTTFKVGKGGSISNVSLAGYAGDVDANVAIRSYTDLDESMADFVKDSLVDGASVALTNALGNVGIVVGVSGNVASGSSTSTLNGLVSVLKARGVMSMVAGSVDRVAAIVSISNVTLNGTIFGAYKNTPVAHASSIPQYYSGPEQTGALQTGMQIGGSLMDGAIVTKLNNTTLSNQRVFVL